ncbi:MAG TPA: deoxyguanosinetriphosphate triphosphohydrolase [Terriglobales bacterium]|nr:deoxyguanosinetriphosphate triphosphohydrolase [Terriglobales bacterium]
MTLTLREEAERRERAFLAPWATFADEADGRERPEEPCDVRTAFVRDRDRIIHCKAFRRLKHKTQVFLAPEGDHYRTRLTHTLEVSQIARTVARALRLNEDLAEAISLGHDLGHTAFGHSGEAILNEICPLGFTHFEQSVRVVEVLEKDRQGLNLTKAVRDGIRMHSAGVAEGERAMTPEGRIVALADKMAYVNHDIDDALRAGILRPEQLPCQYIDVLGASHSARINTLIHAVIEGSDGPEIRIAEPVGAALWGLRDFLFAEVYFNPRAKGEERKAKAVMRMLYEHFLENPAEMPAEFTDYIEADGLTRVVLDYVSGMTDRYAIARFEGLFVPKNWQ